MPPSVNRSRHSTLASAHFSFSHSLSTLSGSSCPFAFNLYLSEAPLRRNVSPFSCHPISFLLLSLSCWVVYDFYRFANRNQLNLYDLFLFLNSFALKRALLPCSYPVPDQIPSSLSLLHHTVSLISLNPSHAHRPFSPEIRSNGRLGHLQYQECLPECRLVHRVPEAQAKGKLRPTIRPNLTSRQCSREWPCGKCRTRNLAHLCTFAARRVAKPRQGSPKCDPPRGANGV
jgi:hypothetical protein